MEELYISAPPLIKTQQLGADGLRNHQIELVKKPWLATIEHLYRPILRRRIQQVSSDYAKTKSRDRLAVAAKPFYPTGGAAGILRERLDPAYVNWHKFPNYSWRYLAPDQKGLIHKQAVDKFYRNTYLVEEDRQLEAFRETFYQPKPIKRWREPDEFDESTTATPWLQKKTRATLKQSQINDLFPRLPANHHQLRAAHGPPVDRPIPVIRTGLDGNGPAQMLDKTTPAAVGSMPLVVPIERRRNTTPVSNNPTPRPPQDDNSAYLHAMMERSATKLLPLVEESRSKNMRKSKEAQLISRGFQTIVAHGIDPEHGRQMLQYVQPSKPLIIV